MQLLDTVVTDGIKRQLFQTEVIALSAVNRRFTLKNKNNLKTFSPYWTKIKLLVELEQYAEDSEVAAITSLVTVLIVERDIRSSSADSPRNRRSMNACVQINKVQPLLDSMLLWIPSVHILQVKLKRGNGIPYYKEFDREQLQKFCQSLLAACLQNKEHIVVNELRFADYKHGKGLDSEEIDSTYKRQLIQCFSPSIQRLPPFQSGGLDLLQATLDCSKLLRSLIIECRCTDEIVDILRNSATLTTNLRSVACPYSFLNGTAGASRTDFIHDCFGKNEKLKKMTWNEVWLNDLVEPTALTIVGQLSTLKLFFIPRDEEEDTAATSIIDRLRTIFTALPRSARCIIHWSFHQVWDAEEEEAVPPAPISMLHSWQKLAIETGRELFVHFVVGQMVWECFDEEEKLNQVVKAYRQECPEEVNGKVVKNGYLQYCFRSENGKFIILFELDYYWLGVEQESPLRTGWSCCTCFNRKHLNMINAFNWKKDHSNSN